MIEYIDYGHYVDITADIADDLGNVTTDYLLKNITSKFELSSDDMTSTVTPGPDNESTPWYVPVLVGLSTLPALYMCIRAAHIMLCDKPFSLQMPMLDSGDDKYYGL